MQDLCSQAWISRLFEPHFGQPKVLRRGDFDVHRIPLYNSHRNSQPFYKGGFIGANITAGPGLPVSPQEEIICEALGRLDSPEFASIQGPGVTAFFPFHLDRILYSHPGNRSTVLCCRQDDLLDCLSTHKRSYGIMDEHNVGPEQKTLESPPDGILSLLPSRNDAHELPTSDPGKQSLHATEAIPGRRHNDLPNRTKGSKELCRSLENGDAIQQEKLFGRRAAQSSPPSPGCDHNSDARHLSSQNTLLRK